MVCCRSRVWIWRMRSFVWRGRTRTWSGTASTTTPSSSFSSWWVCSWLRLLTAEWRLKVGASERKRCIFRENGSKVPEKCNTSTFVLAAFVHCFITKDNRTKQSTRCASPCWRNTCKLMLSDRSRPIFQVFFQSAPNRISLCQKKI